MLSLRRISAWAACLAVLLLTGALLVLFRRPLLLALGAVLLLAAGAWAAAAWRDSRDRRAFEARHGSRGRRLILVYSRSPNWQAYVEQHWLPKYRDLAVVLDWSERARWPTGVVARETAPEVRLFRRYGGQREFNPLAIAVPRRGRVRVVRFFRAFRDYKHGRDRALRRAEAELDALAAALRAQ